MFVELPEVGGISWHSLNVCAHRLFPFSSGSFLFLLLECLFLSSDPTRDAGCLVSHSCEGSSLHGLTFLGSRDLDADMCSRGEGLLQPCQVMTCTYVLKIDSEGS